MADTQSAVADKPAKTNRPGLSAFKQQRLKAWQPILTPKTVLPTFFAVGIVFLPLGIFFFITSAQVNEVVLDYTRCHLGEDPPPVPITSWNYNNETGNCTITFQLPVNFSGPVYMYYALTNYYQNHRRYVSSFSAGQLQGQDLSVGDISTDCTPLVSLRNAANETLPIYPCGLIANSVFNDTLDLTPVYMSGSYGDKGAIYVFDDSNIAWPSDVSKYINTAYTPQQALPPPNWAKYNGTYNGGMYNISTDQHLMVWMRTAGLPNFRKLYAKCSSLMPEGTYSMTVSTRYPVMSFSGTKAVVLSTTSWLGGKNPFLGIAYIVVGVLCLVLGIGFLIRHVVKPRKLGDTSLLSWNR